MANIMFKRGLQANLDSLQTVEDGVFYLTKDTNRLYVGKGSELALLNQTVQIVPEVTNLPSSPTKNDFYYCTKENVLAVYTGNDWKQINPDTDTNDDTYVSSVSVGAGVVSGDTLTYEVTLNQQTKSIDGKTKDAESVKFNLSLTKDELESIIHDVAKVGLEVASDSNTAIIKTQGYGSDNSKTAIIKGGSNVTVNVEDSEITVAAKDTTYTLTSLNDNGASTVRLSDNSNKNQDIIFKAGKDLTVSADNTGIVYSHNTINTNDNKDTDATQLTTGAEVDIVTKVTTDNGHVTEVTTKKYKLPTANTAIESISGTGDNDWKVTIEENSGKDFAIDFSADAAALKDELEETIKAGLAAANTALTYKGTISNYDALLLKTGVEIGDVWLLNSTSGDYKIGDMFIATVESDADHVGGIILSDKVVWTHIPSGDELNTDTLFYGDVTVSGGSNTGGSVTYTLQAKIGADDSGKNPSVPDENEELVIKGGKDILITGSGTEATINHKTYSDEITASNSAATSNNEFTAITDVTLDNGHIVGISTQKFIPGSFELSGSDDQIKLKNTVTNKDAGSITTEGDNWINIDVTSNKLKVSHKAAQTTGGNEVSVTNNGTLSAEGELNIISKIAYDANGHVSNVETSKLTLPDDTTYSLYVGQSSNSESAYESNTAKADPYLILKDDDGKLNSVRINGDGGSLAVEAKSSGINISMVWGEF